MGIRCALSVWKAFYLACEAFIRESDALYRTGRHSIRVLEAFFRSSEAFYFAFYRALDALYRASEAFFRASDALYWSRRHSIGCARNSIGHQMCSICLGGILLGV